ncbi:lipase family protein [Azonexus sp. R2A61]|uniref:lipase family protein n=1 Tax=Azonexus sp. R2A61 TaxID=2744443 RepID=UPI001F3E11CA|nr:lipase family protein [Azonexus sp. R2A61]
MMLYQKYGGNEMRRWTSSWTHAAIAAAVFAGLSGCGTFKMLEASRSDYDAKEKPRKPGKNDVTEPDAKADWFLVDMSNRFGLMALFALTVYRYDLSPEDRDQHACDYLDKQVSGDKDFGMPRSADSKMKWERWVPQKKKAPMAEPCYNAHGLFYETYVRRDEHDHIREAVIAYRGTENRAGQWWPDWSANLSNALGFEPEEYVLARERLANLVEHLRDEAGPNVPPPAIYAVGHSLGGGLAQQAGYLSEHIKEVYTFDTSPVTNWTHLRLLGLVDRGYPVIHRVYNGGEALAGIRALATAATATRYGRHDVGIQFGEKAPVKGHSMAVLACGFAKILSESDIRIADHGYPISYIKQHVLRRDAPSKCDVRVCDEENEGEQADGNRASVAH